MNLPDSRYRIPDTEYQPDFKIRPDQDTGYRIPNSDIRIWLCKNLNSLIHCSLIITQNFGSTPKSALNPICVITKYTNAWRLPINLAWCSHPETMVCLQNEDLFDSKAMVLIHDSFLCFGCHLWRIHCPDFSPNSSAEPDYESTRYLPEIRYLARYPVDPNIRYSPNDIYFLLLISICNILQSYSVITTEYKLVLFNEGASIAWLFRDDSIRKYQFLHNILWISHCEWISSLTTL